VPSRIIWWMVAGGQGVIACGVVTFAAVGELELLALREESMAGDWLQVWTPLGLWLVEGLACGR
jgi:hypothetical protein